MAKVAGWICTFIVVVCSWMLILILMAMIAALIWPGEQKTVPFLYALSILIVPIWISIYCGIKFKKAYDKKHVKNKNSFIAKPNASMNKDGNQSKPVGEIKPEIVANEPKAERYSSVMDDPKKTLEEKNAAYLAMRDKEVERLNAAYDFNSIEGIRSIPVPCVEVNGNSATGRVEYYLRGQCFARYEKEENEELAVACLKKAQELMFVSDMIWKRYDFLRLVEYLYKIGRWDEAETELARIDKFFGRAKAECPFHIKNAIQYAKASGTDLIEAHTASPYCSECARYTDRIYSISGRDRRFPKLPSKFTSDKTWHYLSCLSLYPYFDGISEPSFTCDNVSEYSNRQFRDERTQEEISRYNDWAKAKSKYIDDQKEMENNMLERAKTYYEDMQIFKWIQENLPDLCPKSLSGFRRMRSTNSNNYQKLAAEAAKLGKEI